MVADQVLLIGEDLAQGPGPFPAGGLGQGDEAAQGGSRPHRAVQAEELGEAGIEHDDPLVGIHHAQPVGHVVERGVEALVPGSQLHLLDLERVVAKLKLRIGAAQGLVGLFELDRHALEVFGQRTQLALRPLQEPVVPAQEGEQEAAEDDQARRQAREQPMEAD